MQEKRKIVGRLVFWLLFIEIKDAYREKFGSKGFKNWSSITIKECKISVIRVSSVNMAIVQNFSKFFLTKHTRDKFSTHFVSVKSISNGRLWEI